MITIQGKGASAGVASGPLYFYRRAHTDVKRTAVANVEAEWRRFTDARAEAERQLGALAEKARAEAGAAAALLFESHRMMAEDVDYEAAVAEGIRGGLNAEAVIADTRDRFVALFAAMDDDYLRSRAADVRDVSDRIIGILTGAARRELDSAVPVILAADELAPSELIQFGKSRLLGIITQSGSCASHTAILARTMGIPAIVGAGARLAPEYAGREAVMDGGAGVAVIDPDEDARARLPERRAERPFDRLKGLENVTRDGRRVRICCNINAPEDARAVLENDGGGVGLFRSEFLYLERGSPPTEDEQFEAYRSVLAAMEGREVVIRTLDLGADKQAAYFPLPAERNPAMGSRALRVCLNHPALFKTQLRALYRASAFGRLRVMFPLVTSVWELREAKALCAQARRELKDAGVAHDAAVPLGVVIETPAAAVISDLLAKEADFFSCGTNDLAQYTLACDRQNDGLGRYFDPYHPAVLRLLKLTADNAHRNGIPIGVCGELAADPRLTAFFLAIGVDELSVAPRAVLPLRARVRELDVARTRDAALEALAGGGAEEAI